MMNAKSEITSMETSAKGKRKSAPMIERGTPIETQIASLRRRKSASRTNTSTKPPMPFAIRIESRFFRISDWSSQTVIEMPSGMSSASSFRCARTVSTRPMTFWSPTR